MGYDYGNGCTELYTSYNHGFYFYQYLDREKGIRFIYNKQGRDILPFLYNMRSALQGSPAWTYNTCQCFEEHDYSWKRNDDLDGWTPSIGNALWFLEKIIEACIKNPIKKWYGD